MPDLREKSHDGGVDLKKREREDIRPPRMYRVIILNDDYTPMEFVVLVISTVFRKSLTEANQLTLEVHTKGSAIAGVYTHEIAETKVLSAQALAESAGHPLQLTMEPDA